MPALKDIRKHRGFTQIWLPCPDCGKERWVYTHSIRYKITGTCRCRSCSARAVAKIRLTQWEIRFWSRVKKTQDCWIWTGASDPNGYGNVNTGHRHYDKAHRVTYKLTFGKIPSGMSLLHKCDNPQCVNPSHLFLGNPHDNMLDWTAKGKNPMVKLSVQQVIEIKEALIYKHRGLGRELSKKYGVDESTICDIKAGRTWSHIILGIDQQYSS